MINDNCPHGSHGKPWGIDSHEKLTNDNSDIDFSDHPKLEIP